MKSSLIPPIFLKWAGRVNTSMAIFLIQIPFVLLRLFRRDAFLVDLHEDFADYSVVDFSSIRSALSSHRTVGLPLLLRLYRLFTGDSQFHYWPHLQIAFFIVAVAFLHRSLLKAQFRPWSVILITTSLLWNTAVNIQLNAAMTEPIAVSILLILLGTLLTTTRSPGRYSYLSLFGLLFLLYQVRPAMMYFVVLLPILGTGARFLMVDRSWPKTFKYFCVLLCGGLIPFLSFCFLRLVLVGQFGLVAFTGITAAMPAVGFLDEATAHSLPAQLQPLGFELLNKKRNMTEPCRSMPEFVNQNPSYDSQKTILIADCWGLYSIFAWLAEIKHLYGREPFPDAERNIMPWQFEHLGRFVSINSVEIDQELKKFSFAVLSKHSRQYLRWVLWSYRYGVETWFRGFFADPSSAPKSDRLVSPRNLIKIGGLLWLGLILILMFQGRKVARNYYPHFKQGIQDLLVVSLIAFLNFFSALGLIVLISKPSPARYLDLPSFFIPAVLWLIVFMPIYVFLRGRMTRP